MVEQQAWLLLARLVPEVMVVELIRYDASDPLLICYRYSHTRFQYLLNSDFDQYLCLCAYVCAFSPQFTNNNVMSFASIVAHELGHNLGMNHDDGRNCKCDVTHCIMNSGAT